MTKHDPAERQAAKRAKPAARATPVEAGQPLDTATRSRMEPRFGHDFSGVRVHTGAEAAEAASAANALAYTIGQDVVFGGGQYAPGTTAGQRLLAHELAHVVQQSNGQPTTAGARPADPHDAAETEARHAALAVEQGRDVRPAQRAQGRLYRDVAGAPTAAPAPPTPASPLPPAETFEQAWSTFERHRFELRDAEAAAMVETLLARMMADDAINHAGELAVWLIGRNSWPQAQRALRALEDAWWIRFVMANGPGVPMTALSGFGALGPERLIELAEQQAGAAQHARARELFGMAFLFLQMQLIGHSDRRFKALSDMSRLDDRVSSGFALFRLWSYGETGSMIGKMRRIISFYKLQERRARSSSQPDQAQQFASLDAALRQHLRDKALISGSGDGSRAITMEASRGSQPRRGTGYTLHGADGREEFVTPLPGEPRPDELGSHPAYSASMEELLEHLGGQEDFVGELYQHPQIRAAFGARPIQMADLNTRLRVWRIMYEVFQTAPAPGCDNALCSLLRMMERYLRHFTVHTGYNIRDFGVSYLDSQFPEDLAGRAVRDCGVYALTVAYEVYRTARGGSPRLPVGFQLYHTLEHAMLVIFDQGANTHYVVSNDQITGPKTGDAAGTVALVYGNLMGRNQLASVGARSSLLSTDMSDAAFRDRSWQNYQSGARLGLETEPRRDASDTRSEGQRGEDTYRHYYQAMEIFDREASAANARMDALVARLGAQPAAGQAALVRGELDFITSRGVGLTQIMDAYTLNQRTVGLRPGRNMPVERVGLVRSDRETANHPIVRLGCALLFAERQGHTLTAEQQAILKWIRGAPLASFGPALQAYEQSGRPPVF